MRPDAFRSLYLHLRNVENLLAAGLANASGRAGKAVGMLIYRDCFKPVRFGISGSKVEGIGQAVQAPGRWLIE